MEQFNGGKLLPMFHREHLEVKKWTKQMWTDHLERGSDRKRLQYCLDSHGYLLHVRAIQSHVGGNKVDPSMQDNVQTFRCTLKIDCRRVKIQKKDGKPYSSRQWIP